MFNLMTYDLPSCPPQQQCFLDIILKALEVRDRVPEEAPNLGLGAHYVRENLRHLTLEQMAGGWVANIIFKPSADPQKDCMTVHTGTPIASAIDAFLLGASVVCELVSGSDELPFSLIGNKLMMARYG